MQCTAWSYMGIYVLITQTKGLGKKNQLNSEVHSVFNFLLQRFIKILFAIHQNVIYHPPSEKQYPRINWNRNSAALGRRLNLSWEENYWTWNKEHWLQVEALRLGKCEKGHKSYCCWPSVSLPIKQGQCHLFCHLTKWPKKNCKVFPKVKITGRDYVGDLIITVFVMTTEKRSNPQWWDQNQRWGLVFPNILSPLAPDFSSRWQTELDSP